MGNSWIIKIATFFGKRPRNNVEPEVERMEMSRSENFDHYGPAINEQKPSLSGHDGPATNDEKPGSKEHIIHNGPATNEQKPRPATNEQKRRSFKEPSDQDGLESNDQTTSSKQPSDHDGPATNEQKPSFSDHDGPIANENPGSKEHINHNRPATNEQKRSSKEPSDHNGLESNDQTASSKQPSNHDGPATNEQKPSSEEPSDHDEPATNEQKPSSSDHDGPVTNEKPGSKEPSDHDGPATDDKNPGFKEAINCNGPNNVPVNGSKEPINRPHQGCDEGANRYRIGEQPLTRNILIIGKTGAGKATIANKILGENMFPVSSSVESVTKEASNRQVNKVLKSDSAHTYYSYTIKLVDTVGMSYRLNPRQLAKEIVQFMKDCPQGIHLVIFAIKNGRVTEEDQAAFDLLTTSRLQLAEKISPISALVITGCEELNDTMQQKLRHEFSSAPIGRFMQKNIYTVGFPNTDVVKAELRSFYEENIEVDKNKLKDLIAGCVYSIS